MELSKANLFKMEELVEIKFFKDFYKKYKNKINKTNYKIAIYQIIRDSIDLMIKDLIMNTQRNLKSNRIKSINDVKKSNRMVVMFSNVMQSSLEEIRFFLRVNMYDNKSVLLKNNNGKKIIKNLFDQIKNKPLKYISKKQLSKDKYRAIADYISGMTDRYAINLHKNLK